MLADDGKTTWKVFRQSGYLQNNVSKAADILNKLDPAGWLYASNESKAYLKELSSLELISDYTHRLFPEILKIKDADSHFTRLANLDEFHSAARAGQLPNFTYIQPEWTIGESGTGGGVKSVLFHQGKDYHPPGNLDAGENLVKQIYNSLISNRAAWEKTLLIITFDEPIGSFDHIPPPAAIPPWVKGTEPGFKRQYNFNFDRYGGRVPAILVSPLVEKSTVFRSTTSVPFDHTSIIATILKWRGLENKDFGERTKQAPTFENIVSLSSPRTDERDVRFLKLSHKAGEPVHFYDRFNLRDATGKYILGFRENAVFPGSFFSQDPTFSEYFPLLADVSISDAGAARLPTQFYLQNTNNRPDSGEIRSGGGTEVRLVATDDGLGSYNVLGAWKDSRDCYYFNDYMEGDNGKKEGWIVGKRDPATMKKIEAAMQAGVVVAGVLDFSRLPQLSDTLRFGDKVFIQNIYWNGQCLAPDKDYVTTYKGEYYWTIEPILDISYGVAYGVFLKGDPWNRWSEAEDGKVAGTVGQDQMTDAFVIHKCPVAIEYRIHVEGDGWLPWVHLGEVTNGKGRRMEAVEFRFPNGQPPNFMMMGRAHVQKSGWMPMQRVVDKTVLGTTGKSLRLEAIQLVVLAA